MDYTTDRAVLRLAAARDHQRHLIVMAGQALKTIEALRERAGMDASVLARIFTEYSNGT
jgi:hypothetical protein